MKTFEDWVAKANFSARDKNMGGAVGYCVNALAALADERAEARRSSALDRLAQNDADKLAGEPRSYSHWGMHA